MQVFSKYNDGVRFLLAVIDIFTKYGWMIPLKNKTGVEVAGAFEKYSRNENLKIVGR